MKTATIIIVLFVIAAFVVGNSVKVDLGEKEGRVTFVKAMGKWIVQVGRNVKDVTSYTIKQKWLPEVNETK